MGTIEKKVFGRTGHLSTRVIFGAAAFGNVTQAEADQTIDLLMQYGINHFDTAASYGKSEVLLGPWVKHNRDKIFLATKTGERTYQKAKEEIHRSLERLQTDHVDLLQLHYLVNPQEWEVAMGPGGALEAAVEAKAQGLVRFIGVTGHDLAVTKMHMKSLERYDFDSVLLPYNFPLVQNPEYAASFEALVTLCHERNVPVQTIKGVTRSVTFDLEFDGVQADPWGNTKAGFTATTSINRSDWGLTWNAAIEGGGVLVSDKIQITLEVELLKS